MLVLSRDDFMALSKHDQVSDMLVRAAELQRRSYGEEEEVVVQEENNGELGSGSGGSGESEEKKSEVGSTRY